MTIWQKLLADAQIAWHAAIEEMEPTVLQVYPKLPPKAVEELEEEQDHLPSWEAMMLEPLEVCPPATHGWPHYLERASQSV